jgi:hypothetical protein
MTYRIHTKLDAAATVDECIPCKYSWLSEFQYSQCPPFSLKQIIQTVGFVAWLQPSVACISSEVLIPGQCECEGRPVVVGGAQGRFS